MAAESASRPQNQQPCFQAADGMLSGHREQEREEEGGRTGAQVRLKAALITVRLPAKEMALNILKAAWPQSPIRGSLDKDACRASLHRWTQHSRGLQCCAPSLPCETDCRRTAFSHVFSCRALHEGARHSRLMHHPVAGI